MATSSLGTGRALTETGNSRMLDDRMPLEHVPGIGRETAARLHRLECFTVHDLLFHFPRRYVDTREKVPLADVVAGEVNTVRVAIDRIVTIRSPRKRMPITTAELTDSSGTAKAIWFNQPYLERQLTAGTEYIVSGKVEKNRKDGTTFQNPAFELESDEQHHVGIIAPVYPETEGVTSKFLRLKIGSLKNFMEAVRDPLPADIRESFGFPEMGTALNWIHFPESFDNVALARRRFAFEELFCISLIVEEARRRRLSEPAVEIPYDVPLARKRVASLPFTLTDGQRLVTHEIFKDLEAPYAMNRLLQGDVGSGKTVVAALAAAMCIESGFQVALMAPTELLARQHLQTLEQLLPGTEIRLLVGGMSQGAKEEVSAAAAEGAPLIVVGTHALLEETIQFPALGLVVIDEQHRFGVEQRQHLRRKGDVSVNFLAMTATPIPRSLALTKYGDLDLSILTERPAQRGTVTTAVVQSGEKLRAFIAARREIEDGHQAFVICPIIEESEDRDGVASVSTERAELEQGVFAGKRLATLHGKMLPREKDDVMESFRAGNVDVLVTTSVVEVGVDVPNATVMVIESADRFGLAQLHQFRGRVGRSSLASYCYLIQESGDELATERLRAVESTESGFALAEKDLRLRGHGEIGGVRQHGDTLFKVASLMDLPLLTQAQRAAHELLERDPELLCEAELRERMEAMRLVMDLD